MDADYVIEHGKPSIYLFGRDIRRERKTVRVRGFRPYFYVPDENGEFETIFGERVRRVILDNPRMVPREREKYEKTYEAKIPFVYRFLIDAGIKCGFTVSRGKVRSAEDLHIPPRIGYFDIEVESPPEILPVPEDPKYPVVCFSLMDSYTRKKFILILYHKSAALPQYEVFDESSIEKFKEWIESAGEINICYFKSEKSLFLGFFTLISHFDFDILTGWWTNHYDWPYIIERACELRIRKLLNLLSPIKTVSIHRREGERPTLNIIGRQLIDMLEWYRIITKPEGQKDTYDLKVIVKNECGFEYEDWGDRIEIVWNRDHETLIEYMIGELQALSLMDSHRKIIEEVDSRRRVVGVLPEDVSSATKCCLVMLHRVSDKVLPTFDLAEGKEYAGALVAKARPGLYENVAVYDIKSLYPNIIVGMNLSYETAIRDENGRIIEWKKEPEGILPKVVRTLMEEREKLRAARLQLRPDSREYKLLYTREQSLKYHVNSMYGAQKYFMWEICDAVTRTGREILTALAKHVKYKVIYWDTDSLFIQLGTADWEKGIEVEKELNAVLLHLSQKKGFRKPLTLKYESFFSKLFLHASKHYIGLLAMSDLKPVNKLVVKGVIFKKSDSAPITREVGIKFFDALLRESKGKALKILREYAERVRNGKVKLSEIAIPKGLQKKLHQYLRESAWVKGVKYGIQHCGFRFREDKRPLLVYVKGVKGLPPTTRICFPDPETADAWQDRVIVDWEKMMMKTIGRLKPFLIDLGVSWDEVMSGTRQTSLEVFI